MKITNPEQIKYLCFEGGGGKGIAYVGMMKALEEKNVLPLTFHGQVKGVAGASAGAITAFLVACGLTNEQVLEETKSSTTAKFKDGVDLDLPTDYDNSKYYTAYAYQAGQRFSALEAHWPIVAGPGSGLVGHRYSQEGSDILPSVVRRESDRFFSKYNEYRASIETDISGWAKVAFPGLGLADTINDKMLSVIDEFFLGIANNILIADCLLFDRGIYGGFEIRKFFADILNRYVIKKIPLNIKASEFTFENFHDHLNVDLVILGTNVSTHRPGVFSRKYTPHFPVIDAVSLSMSIPIAFRPFQIARDVHMDKDDEYNKAYRGLWADGGMLTNLPLQVFNSDLLEKNFEENLGKDIHPQMLAFRLSEGYDPTINMKDYEEKNEDCKVEKEKVANDLDDGAMTIFDSVEKIAKSVLRYTGFDSYLNDLFETILYPANEGQILKEEWKTQIIELYSHCVGTMDFEVEEDSSGYVVMPEMVKSDSPIANDSWVPKENTGEFKTSFPKNEIINDAYEKTLAYFKKEKPNE